LHLYFPAAAQKALIRGAIGDIEAKSCIRFEVLDDYPQTNRAYMLYVKESNAAL
jgi:hypothetical protein